MTYSKEYLTKIAIFKFGGNQKAINDYVEKFDPKNPKYAQDEKEYLALVKAKKTEENALKKLLVENYYIHFYYAYCNLHGMFEWKSPEAVEKASNALSNAFLDEPIEENEDIPYTKDVIEFSRKYGVNINPESVKEALNGFSMIGKEGKNAYKMYYQAFLATSYEKLKEKANKTTDLCKDFEKIMQGIAAFECPEFAKEGYAYGAMSGEELKEFLISLREKDCNLTSKVENELKGKHGAELKKAVYNAEPAEKDEENKFLEKVATLQTLQKMHASRSKSFAFFHPFQNRAEKNLIEEIQKEIRDLSKDKEADELLRSPTIYKKGFEEERQTICDFCKQITDLQEEKTSVKLDLGDDGLSLEKEIEPLKSDIELVEDMGAALPSKK